MKYEVLGATSLRISKIGFGCMSLPTQDASIQIISKAIALGITFFDTADLYDKGENERLLGKAIKEKRKDLIIATKVGNQWKKDGNGWDWNPSKEHIIAGVEASLRRLGTDYIDLYQLHGGTMQDPFNETIEAFEWLKQQGKIRYYGLSSIRPNVIKEWINRSNMASVMLQYSVLDRRPEVSVLHLLQEKNIGVLARGSLAQGLLINKEPKSYLNFDASTVKDAATAVSAVSTLERTPTQTALQFVLQQPAITAAVVGIRTMEQLVEIVGTMSAPPLEINEIEKIKKAVPAHIYEENR
ncbi:MAG: aldo/keto reductase [Chitinophagaceae bacterium]